MFYAGTKPGRYPDAIRVDGNDEAGGGVGTTRIDVIVTPGPIHRIDVQPSAVVVNRGEGTKLSAVALDLYGNEIRDVEFKWESSEGVGVNQEGGFTASGDPGLHEIRVSATGDSGEKTTSVAVGIPPVWMPIEDMKCPRREHTATLLLSGKVLIVGGWSCGRQAELYDPASRTFTRTSSPFWSRGDHTATLLPDGNVLIVGGSCNAQKGETYDPETEEFTLTKGQLITPRRDHRATLLRSGKVLITGGGFCGSGGGTYDSIELFDPETGVFSESKATMLVPRRGHRATLLPSGKVLITGGTNWLEDRSTECPFVLELYDPVEDTVEQTGSLIQRSSCGNDAEAYAARLRDGKLLLTSHPTFVEYYDPDSESFTLGGKWQRSWAATVTPLADGLVLIAGGDQGGTLDTGRIYQPGRDEVISTTNMNTPRSRFQATLLPSGAVLVTGGEIKEAPGVYNPLQSAELFFP